jgi:hypothetical protein
MTPSRKHDPEEDHMAVHDTPGAPPVAEQEEKDVEFAPGFDGDFDQAPDKAPEPQQAEDQKEQLDTIVPHAKSVSWTIGPEGMERTFIQKPLSFIGKAQWFALVGGVLDDALSGENGMSLNSLFDTPVRGGNMRPQDFRDADMFVQAVGKLLRVAPNFLIESYCIWLNVPDYDHEIVGQMMMLPEDEGGLSDEQGMKIIEVFLDQNYKALADFFSVRLSALQARVQKLNTERNESAQSKR